MKSEFVCRVEDGDFVGEAACVVLVAKERGDVAGHELVVELRLEQHVLDQLAEADAGLTFRYIDVDGGEGIATVVRAGGGTRRIAELSIWA